MSCSRGHTVNLAADNAIRLEASKNTWEQHGTNKSSGTSIGVGYAAGAQNGFTIELGMSQGKGKQDGSEVGYNNTHVSGGKAVNVTSGGDLTLRGAVIDAPKVTADVGGNLSIESLQDTSSQVSKQNSSGFNASLCIPPICYGVSTVGWQRGGGEGQRQPCERDRAVGHQGRSPGLRCESQRSHRPQGRRHQQHARVPAIEKSVKPADKPDSVHRRRLATMPA